MEAVNVVAAIRLFASRMENQVVRVRCDNSAAVIVISTGTGHCPVLLSCARAIWKCTAESNIVIQVTHIEGRDNHVADVLS